METEEDVARSLAARGWTEEGDSDVVASVAQAVTRMASADVMSAETHFAEHLQLDTSDAEDYVADLSRVRFPTPISTKRKKRTTNTYLSGQLFESPMTPMGKKLGYTMPSVAVEDISIGHKSRVCELLHTVGFPKMTSSVLEYLPSRKQCASVLFWRSNRVTDTSSANVVISTIEAIVRNACAVLISGGDKETPASIALHEAFLRSHTPPPTANPEEGLLDTLVNFYRKTRRHSTEKRALRACLVALSWDCLEHRAKEISGFVMSRRGFTAGQRDAAILDRGHSLSNVVRSVSRFNRSAVEAATPFILSPKNVSFLSWGTKRVHPDG